MKHLLIRKCLNNRSITQQSFFFLFSCTQKKHFRCISKCIETFREALVWKTLCARCKLTKESILATDRHTFFQCDLKILCRPELKSFMNYRNLNRIAHPLTYQCFLINTTDNAIIKELYVEWILNNTNCDRISAK